MSVRTKQERKDITYEKAKKLFTEYDKFALVKIDNVVSTQLKQIKKDWGTNAEFLIGKKSSITRAITDLNKPELIEVRDMIKGSVCVVFFKGDIKDIKTVVEKHQREACAKVGDVAQDDVWIESMVTAMTPEKTSFFQVLGIATKITKGKVEIISRFKVLGTGDIVGPSQANLLSLLNVTPFNYKMVITKVYENGVLYDSAIIDITEEQVEKSMRECIAAIAAVSLGANFITQASVPYTIRNSFKDILSISLASGFEIKEQALLGA